MTNLKEQISQLDEMTAPELDLIFFQTVLDNKQIQRLIDLPDYSIALGSRDGWKILHSELKKCFLINSMIKFFNGRKAKRCKILA